MRSNARSGAGRLRGPEEDPVFYRGKQCGSIRRFSDVLLIFMAKGAMPDKYAERTKIETESDNPPPIDEFREDRRGWNAPGAGESRAALDRGRERSISRPAGHFPLAIPNV